MRKDILTIKNIKKDIRQYYIAQFFGIAFCVGFGTLFAWLTYACWKYGGIVGWYTIPFFICSIAFIATLITTIISIPKWKKLISNEPIIVVDKLVGKAVEHPIESNYSWLCFYFSSYGRYKTLVDEFNKCYTWSENFAMTPQRIFDRADVNEEFYLVLDKKHSGKILEIYSKEVFVLEGEEQIEDIRDKYGFI